MSKKYGVMDFHFQLWNMKRHLRCNYIYPDTIDIFSLIDRKLHFPENQELIDAQLGISDHEKCFNCGKLFSSKYAYHTCVTCIKDKEHITEHELKIIEGH